MFRASNHPSPATIPRSRTEPDDLHSPTDDLQPVESAPVRPVCFQDAIPGQHQSPDEAGNHERDARQIDFEGWSQLPPPTNKPDRRTQCPTRHAAPRWRPGRSRAVMLNSGDTAGHFRRRLQVASCQEAGQLFSMLLPPDALPSQNPRPAPERRDRETVWLMWDAGVGCKRRPGQPTSGGSGHFPSRRDCEPTLLLGVAVVQLRELRLRRVGRKVRLDDLIKPGVVLIDRVPDLDYRDTTVFHYGVVGNKAVSFTLRWHGSSGDLVVHLGGHAGHVMLL